MGPVEHQQPAPSAPQSAGAGAGAGVGDRANALATAYQPRREWAAVTSIAWNLLLTAIFLFSGAASVLSSQLSDHLGTLSGARWWLPVLYLVILFCGYALLNAPLELWFGYLEERQFALAKSGIRAWLGGWLIGTSQHGVMCVAGSCLLLALRNFLPHTWLLAAALALLALFLLTTRFWVASLPPGLFQITPADTALDLRLREICGAALPPILVYSAPELRDFSGGLVGLGSSQRLLISRSAADHASQPVLRFVLLHEMGHRHHHHILLSALAGWAWAMLGLATGEFLADVDGFPPPPAADHLWIAWMCLWITFWMSIGLPLFAYLGRRLEYQADRFYLRHGGSLDEMRTALNELSQRNLAQTDRLPRRRSMAHPLPTVANRLHAAMLFWQKIGREAQPKENL